MTSCGTPTPPTKTPNTDLQRGTELLRTGNTSEARDVLRAEMERAHAANEASAEAYAASPLAQALLALDETTAAAEVAARGLELTMASGDNSGASHFRQILTMANGSATPFDATAALHSADAMLRKGELEPAIALLRRVLEGAKAAAARGSEASAAGMLAQALGASGRSAEALALGRRALALARELGDDESAQHFQSLCEGLSQPTTPAEVLEDAHGHLAAGRAQEAIELLEPLAEAAEKAKVDELEAVSCGLLAQAHAIVGDPLRALVMAQRALEIASRSGRPEVVQKFQKLLDKIVQSQPLAK